MEPQQALTAFPVVTDAPALAAFLAAVFNARELGREIGSGGGYHIQIEIGDTLLMIGGGGPGLAWLGQPAPMPFNVYVPDIDAAYHRALLHGAESLLPPGDRPSGERTASVKDPEGNLWYIEACEDEDEFSENGPTLRPRLHPIHSAHLVEFLTRALGAHEFDRATDPNGVIRHSTVLLGNSAIELCDIAAACQPMPGMFYLCVDDVDNGWFNALERGALAQTPPEDQTYGHRTASFVDMAGNLWYLASPHLEDS